MGIPLENLGWCDSKVEGSLELLSFTRESMNVWIKYHDSQFDSAQLNKNQNCCSLVNIFPQGLRVINI